MTAPLIRRPTVTRLALAATVVVAALSTAACGSSGPPKSPEPASGNGASSSGAAGAGATTAGEVSGTASDAAGDTALISVGIGSPTPMARASDPALSACDNAIAAAASSPDRSVVAPFHVTMRITSSLGTAVEVGLGGTSALTTNGLVSLPNQPVFWGATYGDAGAQCYGPENLLSAGNVQWTADEATTGATKTWNAWLVLPAAITPNESTGADAVGRLVISPLVRLGGNLAQFDFGQSSSPHVVQCSANDPAVGMIPYIGVVPSAAISHGCS